MLSGDALAFVMAKLDVESTRLASLCCVAWGDAVAASSPAGRDRARKLIARYMPACAASPSASASLAHTLAGLLRRISGDAPAPGGPAGPAA